MTSVFGASSSRRLPTAPLARIWVTPSAFIAKMLARYGTCDGLRRCPSPWRESRAAWTPPISVSVMGPEGRPKGVSISRSSPCPRPASASPRPVPPITPTITLMRTPPFRPPEGRSLARRPRQGPRELRYPEKGKARRLGRALRRKMRRRPTLPHGFPCSTIGSGGLNFRVRDGNGCDPTEIATAKFKKNGQHELPEHRIRRVRSDQRGDRGSTNGTSTLTSTEGLVGLRKERPSLTPD